MKKVLAWALLSIILLSSMSSFAESAVDSYSSVGYHANLVFEIPSYLHPLGGDDVILCFEDISDIEEANSSDECWYGDFLTVFSLNPVEEITQENYLSAISYYREELVTSSINIMNAWQAQGREAGEEFLMITPGQVLGFAPATFLNGAREREAVRADADDMQPAGYVDSVPYAFCYDSLVYLAEGNNEPVFLNMFYYVCLYLTDSGTYAITYCKPVPDPSNIDLNYIDPVVEKVFLSLQLKEKSEAELYYEQYEALVEQDLDAALEALEKAIESDSSNALYFNRYAAGLTAVSRYEEALEMAQKALELDPQIPALHSELSNMYANLGQYDEALAAIDQAIALAPDTALFHNTRANRLNRLERYDEAVEEANTAIELDPQNSNYWSTLASNLSWLDRNDEAIKAADNAIELNPNRLEYYRLASVYAQKMENREKSLGYIDQALAIEKDIADLSMMPSGVNGYADLYYGQYYILNELGRYEEALVAMEHALEILPSQAYYEDYAEALFNAGQYETAIEVINGIGTAYELTAITYSLRAECQYSLGEYEKTLEDIDAGMQIDTEIGRLYRVGAESLFLLGRYDEALEMINGGLEINPDLEQYVLIREKIEKELAKPEDERGKGPTATVTITAETTVNLRAEGNADSKALGKGAPGDVFPCTGTADSGWYEILLPDGQVAYVSNKMARYEE